MKKTVTKRKTTPKRESRRHRHAPDPALSVNDNAPAVGDAQSVEAQATHVKWTKGEALIADYDGSVPSLLNTSDDLLNEDGRALKEAINARQPKGTFKVYPAYREKLEAQDTAWLTALGENMVTVPRLYVVPDRYLNKQGIEAKKEALQEAGIGQAPATPPVQKVVNGNKIGWREIIELSNVTGTAKVYGGPINRHAPKQTIHKVEVKTAREGAIIGSLILYVHMKGRPEQDQVYIMRQLLEIYGGLENGKQLLKHFDKDLRSPKKLIEDMKADLTARGLGNQLGGIAALEQLASLTHLASALPGLSGVIGGDAASRADPISPTAAGEQAARSAALA